MKRTIIFAHLCLVLSMACASVPALAQVAISQLPGANAMTGGEILPIVQGNNTKKATATAIANTASSIGSSSSVVANLSYQSTYAPGARAPLFIWQNPSGSTPAGYNAGQQIFIGNNPTGTPGAGDTVAQTIVVTNGNNRGLLYGQNVVVGLCGPAEGCASSDYINAPVTGLETDVYGSATWLPADRAFNPASGTYVVNGHEIYCQGPQYCTAGLSVWSTVGNGSNWWREGIALNRIANIGLHGVQTAGDTGTQFSVALIQDDSNSANVIQVGAGTHTNILNGPNAQITGSGSARFGNQGEGIGLNNYMVVGGSSGSSGFEAITNGHVGIYCNTDGSSYGQCMSGAGLPLLLGINGSVVVSLNTSKVVTLASALQLGALTFSVLPTCASNPGAVAYITDASAAITTWHQQVTAGGGSNKAFIACNGSGWFAFDY